MILVRAACAAAAPELVSVGGENSGGLAGQSARGVVGLQSLHMVLVSSLKGILSRKCRAEHRIAGELVADMRGCLAQRG